MNISNTFYGRYFDDYSVGDIYRSNVGRTISEADNTWFTLLTMNTNQSHFNAHYAQTTPFGKIIVNSGLTVAIVLGLSVFDTSQKAFANLGWEKIKLTAPVYIGDTLYAESLVLDTRSSETREYAGVVKFRTQGVNQDGNVVLRYERSVFIYKENNEFEGDQFPEPRLSIDESIE